ncbi:MULTISPECIES: DUF4244 domain-containing protein [unclassified Blastococcus]
MTVDQPADQPLPGPDPAPEAVAVPEPGQRPGRLARLRSRAEAGMSTAEYAVGTVAACAFAAVLYRVVSGDSVVTGLTELVDAALATLS